MPEDSFQDAASISPLRVLPSAERFAVKLRPTVSQRFVMRRIVQVEGTVCDIR
jgi:hypothetical protein